MDTVSESPTSSEKIAVIPAQINPTELSDVPTARDGIGFRPYVRAIAWFLSNEKTKPPLTMSIEGPWGSGKSSFMLQLQNELENQNSSKGNQYYVRFNAWRSDKDEALWAAFALTFIKQLAPKIDLRTRVWANAELLWKRLEWKRGWFQLVQFAISCVLFVGLTIYIARHLEFFTEPKAGSIAVVPWLAAAYFGFEKAKKIFGNPLAYDILKYVRNLKYEEKVAFIDRFQDDFADIVKSYVSAEGRVFVLIDDLDRCEVPRAAELLQAINLLLSADQGNLFFILGLDREMVAAGIAAKNEKILPYLAAGRSASSVEKQDLHQIGIEYGYNFLEKFVQVPFRVPRPDDREITSWVSQLTEVKDLDHQAIVMTPSKRAMTDIRAGADPEEFQDVVKKLAQLFSFNPRRLKQFINVFRLRVMIALSTGILAPAQGSIGGPGLVGGITMQQLGLFTAILMRWSQLASDLLQEPILFDKLLDGLDQPPNPIVAKWATNEELRRAIELDQGYSLSGVNLRPLLMIMPDAYSGVLGPVDPTLARTRLVAGPGAQVQPEVSPNFSEFSTPPSVTPETQTGPTGPTGPTTPGVA